MREKITCVPDEPMSMPTLTSVTWSCSQIGIFFQRPVFVELEVIVVVVVIGAGLVLVDDIGAEDMVAQSVRVLFVVIVGHRTSTPSDTKPG